MNFLLLLPFIIFLVSVIGFIVHFLSREPRHPPRITDEACVPFLLMLKKLEIADTKGLLLEAHLRRVNAVRNVLR